MVLNSLYFCLPIKLLISPSYLNEILAGYSNLGCRFFSFITLSMSWPFPSVLNCFHWKISCYPDGDTLVCYLLFFPLLLLLLALLCLIFVSLINMCLGVFCLGFILFGTLWVSWTWLSNTTVQKHQFFHG